VAIGLSLNENGNPGFVKAQVLPTVNGDAIADFAKKTSKKGVVSRATVFRFIENCPKKVTFTCRKTLILPKVRIA
jgi:hypothetical protein